MGCGEIIGKLEGALDALTVYESTDIEMSEKVLVRAILNILKDNILIIKSEREKIGKITVVPHTYKPVEDVDKFLEDSLNKVINDGYNRSIGMDALEMAEGFVDMAIGISERVETFKKEII